MKTVVVVGAGAAGLMAALHAARGAEVVLIERTRDGGRKILISGGGRCNILPSALAPERFVTDSSLNTLRKMLRSWPLDEQRAFFENEAGLRLVLEEETGKLFPESHRAKDVRDALVRAVQEAGARTQFRSQVVDLRREGDDWSVEFATGESLRANAVIIATGGLSVPATGSDGFGLDLARRMGLDVVDPYPALTPLLGGSDEHHALSGISLRVGLTAGSGRKRSAVEDGFLFTHHGFSGPSVLDLSHHAVRDSDAMIRLRFVTESEDGLDRALRDSRTARTVGAVLKPLLPERLAAVLAREASCDLTTPLANLAKTSRLALIEALVRWPLPWTSHEGYRKAEVTGGGIRLSEVDPLTLESKAHRGLFFVGEVLDAFGPIGGHNFAWAWATGRAAGLAVARSE
jgi:predicted Rossmann fold flavoprotein